MSIKYHFNFKITDNKNGDIKMNKRLVTFWIIFAIFVTSIITVIFKPTKLGLDLVGGSRIVLEAQTKNMKMNIICLSSVPLINFKKQINSVKKLIIIKK